MKPYGLNPTEHPDVGDIQNEGRKSSIGRLPGKGGDRKSYQKPAKKRASRRVYKRRARQQGKAECQERT